MPHQSPEKSEARDTVRSKPDSRGESRSGLRAIIAAIRAHPTGSVAFRTAIAVLGGLVVVVGLALVPLPGPGWLIVFFGLSIWAIEFVWARHLLQYGRRKLGAWTAWVSLQPWPVKLLIGALGLVFVAAVVWLTAKLSFGVDLLAKVQDLFG
ncbi:MAG: TIGR02611 family protein [Hamadaea sp.]|nr:TIGR02611 family protein [Hamadaea sp.]